MAVLKYHSYALLCKMFAISLALAVFLLLDDPLDKYLQDFFYMGGGHWLLEKSLHPWAYYIFYLLPKWLLSLFSVFLLFQGVNSFRNGNKRRALQYGLVFLTLALVPLLISIIKNISLVPCPYNLVEYGGTVEAESIIQFILLRNSTEGSCFPAGHASGGFALLGLVFLARDHKEFWRYLFLANGLGFVMGIYQQARGAHFLSHNLVTQSIAFAVVLLILIIFNRFKKSL